MKIIRMIIIKVSDLYELLQTQTKQEWKENATAFFNEKVLRLEKTEEELEAERLAAEKATWEHTLEALLEGIPLDRKAIVSTMLENQYRHLKEQEAFGQKTTLPIIPIVRRMITDMTIVDLVGVQPITGPVGLVYKLRCIEQEESEDGSLKLSLEIISQAIEAQTRKLKAGWTIEAEQDLKVIHGLNIEAEITAALASEVACEHNTEWLSRISEIANETPYEVDNNVELIIAINKAANEIGRNTRRGAGNWIVVPPTGLVRIQEVANRNMSPRDMFVPTEEKPTGAGLQYVGMLNKTMKVYVNVYQSEDEILVGYKGGNGETDAGLIFSPYVSLMPSGVIVNPETFAPLMSLMTRYGVSQDDDSHKYYEKIKITYKDNL
jgi:hypothetical protein